jgi:hypothetical protein
MSDRLDPSGKIRTLYADLLMGMRIKGKQAYTGTEYIGENEAAKRLYGEVYTTIDKDFTRRVAKDLSTNGDNR